MKSKKEKELNHLDSLIESWKKIEEAPWKAWAYGYALCLRDQGVLDFDEVENALIERGIIRR